MTTFLDMLRANGFKTWAETSYRPAVYHEQKPPTEPEDLTPEEQESRLASIRATPLVPVGMDSQALMRYAYGAEQYDNAKAVLTRRDCALLADRIFLDTELPRAVLVKLLRRIPRELHGAVYERLRLKGV